MTTAQGSVYVPARSLHRKTAVVGNIEYFLVHGKTLYMSLITYRSHCPLEPLSSLPFRLHFIVDTSWIAPVRTSLSPFLNFQLVLSPTLVADSALTGSAFSALFIQGWFDASWADDPDDHRGMHILFALEI